MNIRDFSKVITDKALSINGPFKADDLDHEVDNIEEILDDSGLFFCSFDSCGTRTYLSKKYFFNKSVFTVHLTGYEVKKKVLAAPFRFAPFTEEILPLIIDGVEMPAVKSSFPVKCLESIYSLDHGRSLIKHLNEISESTLLNLNSLSGIKIDAYSLDGIDLSLGDHLKITIQENSLCAEVVNSEDIDISRAQHWCEDFEKSILSVLREFGPFTDLYTQLEMAYFYGSENLRRQNGLAIRDFLKLSRKLRLCDFVFQKIIWFSESDPLNSIEAVNRLEMVQHSFEKQPEVNSSFYLLMGDELQEHFVSGENESVEFINSSSPVLKSLQRTVRRVALWVKNNKFLLADNKMPGNEVLMFDAAFMEFQFLCSFYLRNKDRVELLSGFEEALELNFEILSGLMDFLKEYYLSLDT